MAKKLFCNLNMPPITHQTVVFFPCERQTCWEITNVAMNKWYRKRNWLRTSNTMLLGNACAAHLSEPKLPGQEKKHPCFSSSQDVWHKSGPVSQDLICACVDWKKSERLRETVRWSLFWRKFVKFFYIFLLVRDDGWVRVKCLIG